VTGDVNTSRGQEGNGLTSEKLKRKCAARKGGASENASFEVGV